MGPAWPGALNGWPTELLCAFHYRKLSPPAPQIAPARLHPRTLTASGGSATRGVGESLAGFVEGEQVDVVVLGSRGMGSIKR